MKNIEKQILDKYQIWQLYLKYNQGEPDREQYQCAIYNNCNCGACSSCTGCNGCSG